MRFILDAAKAGPALPPTNETWKTGASGRVRVASLGPLSIISCLCPVYHISPSPHKEQARGGRSSLRICSGVSFS